MPESFSRQWLISALLAAASTAAAQVGDVGQEARVGDATELFQRAFDAARAGEPQTHADSAALRNHPLYDYLQAERLGYELGRIEAGLAELDATVEAFLESHFDLPVAWSLRYQWAASLARREIWDRFVEVYDSGFVDDAMHCQYLDARIALDRIEGIAAEIIRRYLTARQLPPNCEPVFQWLRNEGALTDAHIEERVRLLLDSGQTQFARVIAGRLPEERAAPLIRRAELLDSPALELDAVAQGLRGHDPPEALLAAWTRLARDAPLEAMDLYPRLMSALRLDADARNEYALALALGLAWDRRPEALTYFGMIDATALDDYALGWRARAALWRGDWTLAQASLDAMSAAEREDSIWLYWAARIVEELENRRAARPLYEAVVGKDNFYAALAAARLRRRVEPTLVPLPKEPAQVAALARRPALERALALYELGLPISALREWRYGTADLDSVSLRQTIHVAAEWRWFDLAVATATRAGVFNDYPLLYPQPYPDAVRLATRATGVRRELVYGVMRQESLFRADAVSAAGARGLMQLRPGTAAQLRGEHIGSVAAVDLLDPEVNVLLGSAELARLLARYEDRIPIALAAYNAGPAAAERWLPPDPMDADVWIENIPYNETRAYVRRVLWNTLVFRWLETSRPQDAQRWLARIPRAGN